MVPTDVDVGCFTIETGLKLGSAKQTSDSAEKTDSYRMGMAQILRSQNGIGLPQGMTIPAGNCDPNWIPSLSHRPTGHSHVFI